MSSPSWGSCCSAPISEQAAGTLWVLVLLELPFVCSLWKNDPFQGVFAEKELWGEDREYLKYLK